MSNYPNWFEGYASEKFKQFLLPEFSGKKNLRFLQIGAYTGDASVWLAYNLLQDDSSYLNDVDTWEGSDEVVHKSLDWSSVFDEYIHKTAGENVFYYKQTSDEFFEKNTETYDFVYIDGDHTAEQTYKDGINGWKYLKHDGILAFDDYTWSEGKGEDFDPKKGIDKFLTEKAGEYKILEMSVQVWIKKNGKV